MFKYFITGAIALCLMLWIIPKYGAEAVVISLPPIKEEMEENIPQEDDYESETEVVIIDTKEKLCLAKAIYFEARNQSIEGKIAVGTVVMNRVKTGMHPNTICEVVHTGCQFSWNCDKSKKYNPEHHKNIAERQAWNESLMLANDMILEYNSSSFDDITKGATYFHASYVSPEWRKWKKLQRTVKIDKHIFYKMKE
jgi:spore germination cell wall hydrolase CwlJ-like protein